MSLPRMSWHIGDYKRDTGHLRAAGHGAYFMLCMHYWATGGLPDDDKQLATIACMTDREWKEHRPIIRALFKGKAPWQHTRIDKELKLAQEKYEKRSTAGKKGGEAKANAKQNPSNATAETYQPITDNPNQVDDDGDARAKPPLIRSEAFDLSEEIAKLCGHDPNFVPTAWCGAPHRVEMWLTQGWTREQIMPAVQSALAKKRGKAPVSIQYFERPIAEFIASMSRPLPEVVVDNTPEKINVRPPANSPTAGADRILERMHAFDQPLGGSDGSPDDVRLLSKG